MKIEKDGYPKNLGLRVLCHSCNLKERIRYLKNKMRYKYGSE